MAKKQKKSTAQRHQKQQKKQQRRAARVQKQQGKPSLPQPDSPGSNATVYDDLAVLVPRGDGVERTPEVMMERLLYAAWGTAALADEPEFADILISPLEASGLFVAAAQEYEQTHGSPEEMDNEGREEAYLEALDQAAQKLLTPELQGDLIDALTTLRQRLRRARKKEQLAHAAALQMLLEADEVSDLAGKLGLVQELVRRSISAGFRLAEGLVQLPGVDEEGAPRSPEAWRDWILTTEAGDQLTSLLESEPTLQRFVENQMHQVWEEGTKALINGDLRLEIYAPDEILPAILIADHVLEMHGFDDSETNTKRQSRMRVLFAQTSDYVEGIFTPQRVDQLVHQIDGIIQEQAAELELWRPFLIMLRDTLVTEGGLKSAQFPLTGALLYDVLTTSAEVAADDEGLNTMLPTNVLYYGKDAPLPARIPLRAGPLALVYEAGDLRYIKLGEHELLRRVYVAIRDRNWGTVLPEISNVQMEVGEDEFRISYDVANVQGEIDFRWHGEISGDRNGTIQFTLAGEAHSTFIRNRIGFCVLHPMAVAGAQARIEQVNGAAQEKRFPRQIAPQLVVDGLIKPMQPFEEMRSLTHEISPGVWATVRFEGEIFETEDQRNWTDASFKTYGTPLRLPFPVEIQQGTKIAQSMTLTLQGVAPKSVQTSDAGQSELTFRILQPEARTRVPALGLGLASHGEALGEEELTRLRALKLDHLRVDLLLADSSYESTLHRAAVEAQAAGLKLHVALHLSAAAEAELSALAVQLAKLQPPVSAWLVFDAATNATPAHLVDRARQHLANLAPGAPFGGGVDGYFTELNRLGLPGESLDVVTYSFNPQVHAFDNSSLIETLPAQAETAASAHQLYPQRPLYLGPVTLRPRFNPNATGPEGQPDPDQLPPQVDVRQMSLFGAGWTLGSIKYLAESGEVTSVTYYETSGWRGVMERPAGSPLPAKFQSFADGVFPLYHVLADVGEFADGEVLASLSSQPLQVDGLVLTKDERLRLILANLSDRPQTIHLENLGEQVRLRVLDEHSAETAMQDPETFRRDVEFLSPAEGDLTLDLEPFAIVTLDSL